jgi:hypothetical protein
VGIRAHLFLLRLWCGVYGEAFEPAGKVIMTFFIIDRVGGKSHPTKIQAGSEQGWEKAGPSDAQALAEEITVSTRGRARGRC